MIFTPRYKARVMACLPGQQPIELARFVHRYYHPADFDAVTSDLDRAWETWLERTTANCKTITERGWVSGKRENRIGREAQRQAAL